MSFVISKTKSNLVRALLTSTVMVASVSYINVAHSAATDINATGLNTTTLPQGGGNYYNFNAAAVTFNVLDGAAIGNDGGVSIDNTTPVANSTLIFDGASVVSGSIEKTNPINTINFNGAEGRTVTVATTTDANNLNFNSTGTTTFTGATNTTNANFNSGSTTNFTGGLTATGQLNFLGTVAAGDATVTGDMEGADLVFQNGDAADLLRMRLDIADVTPEQRHEFESFVDVKRYFLGRPLGSVSARGFLRHLARQWEVFLNTPPSPAEAFGGGLVEDNENVETSFAAVDAVPSLIPAISESAPMPELPADPAQIFDSGTVQQARTIAEGLAEPVAALPQENEPALPTPEMSAQATGAFEKLREMLGKLRQPATPSTSPPPPHVPQPVVAPPPASSVPPPLPSTPPPLPTAPPAPE